MRTVVNLTQRGWRLDCFARYRHAELLKGGWIYLNGWHFAKRATWTRLNLAGSLLQRWCVGFNSICRWRKLRSQHAGDDGLHAGGDPMKQTAQTRLYAESERVRRKLAKEYLKPPPFFSRNRSRVIGRIQLMRGLRHCQRNKSYN